MMKTKLLLLLFYVGRGLNLKLCAHCSPLDTAISEASFEILITILSELARLHFLFIVIFRHPPICMILQRAFGAFQLHTI